MVTMNNALPSVRARRDQAREGGDHRPAQPSGHIRRHVRGGQELEPQLAPLAPPTQLLGHAAQGMPPEQHVHGTIRPQHQQPRRLGPLRQVGEGLDRRVIAPLQVFQEQHQRPVGRQRLQRLGELAQHPGRRHAVQAAVEPLQLRLAHQAGELRQPHRRIPSQHGADLVPRGPVPQPPQRFHEGQIRLPLPIVLDALPPCRPPLMPGGQACQEHLDHRRLPHSRFPTDEDELTGAVGRALKPPLQGLDFALAPHQGAGRQRWGPLHVASHQKPIALPSDSFEILRRRRRVAQRRPNLLYRRPQHARGDMRARPHVLLHFGFGHQAAGMRDQIAQHRQA